MFKIAERFKGMNDNNKDLNATQDKSPAMKILLDSEDHSLDIDRGLDDNVFGSLG